MFSFPECIAWLTLGLTESVAIVILNVIAIIVLTKNRNLRKRSTYLIINLVVADMLAGGSAAIGIFFFLGVRCDVWKFNLTWAYYTLFALLLLFLICSLANIAAISIERLHATFWPFKHRVLKKAVYVLTMAVLWVTAGLLTVALIVVRVFKGISYFNYLYTSFHVICLLVICVSYSSIVIKVRCGAQLRHHGAASREKKKTDHDIVDRDCCITTDVLT